MVICNITEILPHLQESSIFSFVYIYPLPPLLRYLQLDVVDNGNTRQLAYKRITDMYAERIIYATNVS